MLGMNRQRLGLLFLASLVGACSSPSVEQREGATDVGQARSPFPALEAANRRALFAVDWSTTVKAVDQDGRQLPVSGFRFTGHWRLSSSEFDNEHWVTAELGVDHLDLGYTPDDLIGKVGHERYLTEQLQRPVMFRIDPNGAVTKIKAPDDLGALALGTLKAMAAHLQLVNDKAPSERWAVNELDTVGEYAALYTHKTPNEIVRTKQRYWRLGHLGVLTRAGDDGPSEVSGEDYFELQQGRVNSLIGSEHLHFAASELMPELESETRVVLERSSEPSQPTPSAAAQSLSEFAARDIFADVPPAGRVFDLDVDKAGDLHSVADTLQQMNTLKGQAEPSAAAQVRRLEVGLAALLRLSPAAESEAWELAFSDDPDAPRVRLALAQSVRGAAQRRLVEACREPSALSLEEQSRLLVALGENQAPSSYLLDALIELRGATRLTDTVLMSIGGVAYQAQGIDPRLASRAYDVVAAQVASDEATPERLAIALRALGNTGHPKALELSVPYLASDSELVRSAAVRSLRRVADSRVDELLERLRQNDTGVSVQRTILAVQEQRRQRSMGRVH